MDEVVTITITSVEKEDVVTTTAIGTMVGTGEAKNVTTTTAVVILATRNIVTKTTMAVSNIWIRLRSMSGRRS